MAKKEYDVGYKKPPVAHRFQKGKSGNPAGRKAKSKKLIGAHPFDNSLHQAWLDESNREVTVNINGRPTRRTMGRLAIERIFADAAAGKPTAQRIVQSKMTESERILRDRWIEGLDASGYLWRKATAELKDRLARGEIDPVVIPHPDDFVFNKQTNMLEMLGPMDEQQHRAMMAIVKTCERLTVLLESDTFQEADAPGRLHIITQLSEWNALLPPRLKRWPMPKFSEDWDGLFPEDCVLKWALDGS